jgi:hypothetical protein
MAAPHAAESAGRGRGRAQGTDRAGSITAGSPRVERTSPAASAPCLQRPLLLRCNGGRKAPGVFDGAGAEAVPKWCAREGSRTAVVRASLSALLQHARRGIDLLLPRAPSISYHHLHHISLSPRRFTPPCVTRPPLQPPSTESAAPNTTSTSSSTGALPSRPSSAWQRSWPGRAPLQPTRRS